MTADALRALVADELGAPVPDAARALAAAVAARHPGSRAVVFYGAAMRADAPPEPGSLIDLYLLVDDYAAAYDRRWLAEANRRLPPNVFPFRHGRLDAKYAVLTLDDFARLCGPAAGDVSLFARMAQPVRLAWAADTRARSAVVDGVAAAVRTLLGAARPMLDAPGDALALWRRALSLTYACELRAERAGRAVGIVEAQAERCRRVAAASGFGGVLPPASEAERSAAQARWRRWRRRGKLLSVARLLKASFTYSGGVDYLASKVARHSGVPVPVRPWMRRAPLLAGLWLAPRLWLRAAIR